MKRLIFFTISCAFFQCSFSQAIISFGKNNISKDEFIRAYNKNKTAVDNKEKAIREYVELYTNFKLKVKAAQELKLDTSEQFKSEIANFRHQIEENYMIDENLFKQLMNESYTRSQRDLHVIHYSLNINETDDTAKNYEAFMQLYNQLINNKSVQENSFENNGIKKSDLGFVTVFTLPYQYENIVFSLNKGAVSKPFRSKKAWHLFKVIDERPSAGKWKVAQILFSLPPEPKPEIIANAKRQADSVYSLLIKGADFGNMAKSASEDKLTYLNNGELPEFGTGKYDMNFENEVIKLKKDGDISLPFQTSFGIHIIKRLGFTPTPANQNDEAFQFELKQKLLLDDRIKIAKEKFAKDIAVKIGFKKLVANTQELFNEVDTVMQYPDMDKTTTLPLSEKPIISFSNGKVKGKEFLSFARDFKNDLDLYKGETNEFIWEKFQSTISLDYYKKYLEQYSPEFNYQLQEFIDGNLLFEVMEKEVWSEAEKDSIGLLKYYNNNKSKYTWGASADVLIINAAEEIIAKEIMDSLVAGVYWKDLVESNPAQLQGDSGRYELSQLTGYSEANEGAFSKITNNSDGTASFLKFFKLYEANQQRGFKDSKGMLINDYQTVLEKKWIETLRKKYPVIVNEALLQSVIKAL